MQISCNGSASKPSLLKYTAWQSGSGKWYCNDTNDLAGAKAQWYTIPRALDILPDKYCEMLINEFQVDNIELRGSTLIYSWNENNYSKCDKFVKFINKQKIII